MLLRRSFVLFYIYFVSVKGISELPFLNLGLSVEDNKISAPYGIINGTVADITKFPYQAAIYESNTFFASGAILDRKWIITIALPPSDKLRVRVGESTINGENDFHDVEKIVLHPKFTLGTNHNVALLKLRNQLKYSKKVKKINIATTFPNKGAAVVTTGWGYINKNWTTSDRLRKADLFAIPWEDCFEYFIASIVSVSSACAYKDEYVGPAPKEFGNPLVEKKKLVGILQGVLREPFCTNPQCPYVYTDVTVFQEWIKETIENE